MSMNRYLFLLIILLTSSCYEFQAAPKRMFNVSQEFIDLSMEVDGDWDRICIITPYSNNAIVQETIGFKYDIESKSSIDVLDGITLLVATNQNKVVQYFEVPRNNIDFSSLGLGCYASGNAKFKVIKDQNGWFSVKHS
ncbi:hypothetical protein H2508_09745 [Parahaliea sp. F7430]|uniref:Lipoprotein n=1 Tax=Sediminihaliea albiluteola TaxID=2758564 RepID=A0A7W2YJS7_9GAMM|nr:hypothetical protein [Sediminihaliea albiluteola]MBA6413392.1 hypothetical protein [Sediminihaliea albiluteola]